MKEGHRTPMSQGPDPVKDKALALPTEAFGDCRETVVI